MKSDPHQSPSEKSKERKKKKRKKRNMSFQTTIKFEEINSEIILVVLHELEGLCRLSF